MKINGGPRIHRNQLHGRDLWVAQYFDILLLFIVRYHLILYCIVLYCTQLYCIVLYYVVVYCIALSFCTALVLYCIVLLAGCKILLKELLYCNPQENLYTQTCLHLLIVLHLSIGLASLFTGAAGVRPSVFRVDWFASLDWFYSTSHRHCWCPAVCYLSWLDCIFQLYCFEEFNGTASSGRLLPEWLDCFFRLVHW